MWKNSRTNDANIFHHVSMMVLFKFTLKMRENLPIVLVLALITYLNDFHNSSQLDFSH